MRAGLRFALTLAAVAAFQLSLHAPAKAEGDERPVIVIDPGHGGTNLGAFGPAIERHEKHLALDLARLTASRLRRSLPTARVVLTREDDRYLTLAQRVERANRAGAHAFISIHLNASESRLQRGFETYCLSHEASDREAARLARLENAGQSPSVDGEEKAGSHVKAILSDLKQRATHLRSLRLAESIQRALAKARPKAPNRGVRQAPFDVLMGLRMPGVLVEVGHIDHPEEGPELGRRETRARIAEALAAGIFDFLDQAARRPKSKRASR